MVEAFSFISFFFMRSTENGFTHKKKSKKQTISHRTLKGANYVDNLVHLSNTPARAKYLLHCLDQVATGIGLRVNSDKTVHIFWIKRSYQHKPLKIVDQYTYFNNNILSTKSDVNCDPMLVKVLDCDLSSVTTTCVSG